MTKHAPSKPLGRSHSRPGNGVVEGRGDLRLEAFIEELGERQCAVVNDVVGAIKIIAIAPDLDSRKGSDERIDRATQTKTPKYSHKHKHTQTLNTCLHDVLAQELC